MIDLTGFGYARLKKLNGVNIAISFDPAQLTPRVRKAAQKILREKNITGNGQAAKAALMAWSALPRPPAAMRGDSFVLNYKHIPEPVRGEWRRLLVTGRMLALAEASEKHHASDWQRNYIEQCHESDMSALDGQAIKHDRPNYYFYLHLHPDAIRDQMVASFMADTSDTDAFEQAAQLLNGTERIDPDMGLIALVV
jgi:hypothetical protein